MTLCAFKHIMLTIIFKRYEVTVTYLDTCQVNIGLCLKLKKKKYKTKVKIHHIYMY